MTMSLGQIEAQPLLMERLSRYCRAHKIERLGDAIERLIRIGLMVEAVPIGSTLIRRDGPLPEWGQAPAPELSPRGEPEPEGGDILF